MKKPNESVNQEMADVEIIIGKILQIGVIISAVIMLLGLILLIITGHTGFPANQYPTDFMEIGKGLMTFKPYSIMMLGIFCLILTPILRVVVSIYSFYKEHDMLYVVITSIVLVILMISFVFGILR
ncbi:DUF1634 domain-containing protein [Lentilactobacillus sp. IMAU92037]|uniref:DUF1634 domain-containing protein n=1 Tax=Lentilactobacillus TaxID=2767893 RepID=UPI001C2813A3|nr:MULTISPECIES: DUF1634 domain-containing protein [Lentilactobacillus]MBU9789226.1 DUF1634 domain-containing protein [Lentilactobacillus dabitei]MBV0930719.1 DUF1634 domain-containing protein [Lentilactobacillus dabitei]MDM7516857.1 DUF1634 domain-containing protein [Lentilactobacillus sp. TOM.63]